MGDEVARSEMSSDWRLSGVKLGETGDEMVVESSDEVRKGDGKSEPAGSSGLVVVNGSIGKCMGDDRLIGLLLVDGSNFTRLLPMLRFGESRTAGCATSSEEDGDDEEEEEDWRAAVLSADMCGGSYEMADAE